MFSAVIIIVPILLTNFCYLLCYSSMQCINVNYNNIIGGYIVDKYRKLFCKLSNGINLLNYITKYMLQFCMNTSRCLTSEDDISWEWMHTK